MTTLNRFSLFAWGLLAFNIFVILWGALVRATGSGAGCGRHWPSCNGEVIPLTAGTETLIEFTHRLTSGVALLLVIALLAWAYRAYPGGHPVRTGAVFSMLFMVFEALVGAALVLFQLVAFNTSALRAIIGAIHLVNTFLLLSALSLTAWWASGGAPVKLRGQGRWGFIFGLGFAGLLLLGASGAITALGDTLFPATSLSEGLQQKFSPTAHFMVRLRLYHPLIAIGLGIYLILLSGVYTSKYPNHMALRLSRVFMVLYLTQLALGALNVSLLAPIWLQLVHLFFSDILLIVFVIFMASAFGVPAPQPHPAPETSVQKSVYNKSGSQLL